VSLRDGKETLTTLDLLPKVSLNGLDVGGAYVGRACNYVTNCNYVRRDHWYILSAAHDIAYND
jgi:hypothetical protein